MEFNEADSEEDRRHKLRTLQIYNKWVGLGGVWVEDGEVEGKAGRLRRSRGTQGGCGAETKWSLLTLSCPPRRLDERERRRASLPPSPLPPLPQAAGRA